ADTSYSNHGCAEQKPSSFFPNAFHPSAQTPFFAPYGAFISSEEYTFDIYNRWGERIFHSENPGIGWDGSQKGKEAPDGVYIYFSKVKGSDGTVIERKGTVTLLR